MPPDSEPPSGGPVAEPVSPAPPDVRLPSITPPDIALPRITLPDIPLPSLAPAAPSVTPPAVTPPPAAPSGAGGVPPAPRPAPPPPADNAALEQLMARQRQVAQLLTVATVQVVTRADQRLRSTVQRMEQRLRAVKPRTSK